MKLSKIQSQIRTSLIVAALAVATFGQITSAKAQYSSPPIWMPMTMLNVTYDTNSHRLDVVDEATKLGANVYPVLTVATNGTYDPAQPWGVLNGTAYSRRLGWDDANRKNADISLRILNQITNAYGADAGIWIESVSHSPGLNAYLAVGKYGVNATGATNADGTVIVDPTANSYSGIFGTAGSSTRWKWDGQMDHNTFAVSLSDIIETNQLYTATYKVYVGDSLGNEILNADGSSASTTEVWTWQGPTTLVPPVLTILNKVVVEWPCTSSNYAVETAQTLDSPSWTTVTNTPGVIDGKTIILVDPTDSQRYFRLRMVH
jgi:hypothetical protein